MAHGPTRYPAKDECIYCGNSDVKLTDEHIVPYFIGGVHILNEASCLKCNKITTRFEREVAREMWGDARISASAPTRRKNKRKSHIILSDPDDRKIKRKIPYTEYPAAFLFYYMQKAGFLQGVPEKVDLSRYWTMKFITDDAKLKKFEEKYPGKLIASFKHVPNDFGRLIAKIGYCQALTLLNANDFNDICLPYILGEKENISFVVGSDAMPSKPDKASGYKLETACFGSYDHIVIVSTVRLLANGDTPTYHVIVGEVLGSEKVGVVLKKLKGANVETLPKILNFDLLKEHWMPIFWPLP